MIGFHELNIWNINYPKQRSAKYQWLELLFFNMLRLTNSWNTLKFFKSRINDTRKEFNFYFTFRTLKINKIDWKLRKIIISFSGKCEGYK